MLFFIVFDRRWPRNKLAHPAHPQKRTAPARPPAPLSIPAEAALSFLKDTKGAVTWTVSELAATLKIARSDAARVIALLQAQGYVQATRANGEWMTTPSGETVSGAKQPRFDRESVERALDSLRERIRQANKDAKSPFKISGAVAFGDFLVKGRARVQAADVGIQLARRGNTRVSCSPRPTPERSARSSGNFAEELHFWRSDPMPTG